MVILLYMKKKALLDSRKVGVLNLYSTKIMLWGIHLIYFGLFYVFLGVVCGFGECSTAFFYGALAGAAAVFSLPLLSLYLMEKDVRFGFFVLINLAFDLVYIIRSLLMGTYSVITPVVVFWNFILMPLLFLGPLVIAHICIFLHTINIYKNKKIRIRKIINWSTTIWVILFIIFLTLSPGVHYLS